MTDFLTALYGDLPDGHWFYLQTHWFQDVAVAVKLAEQTTAANVYWPIAFHAHTRKERPT
jgi:hypothetical protein